MNAIADRYRKRAEAFERKVAATRPDQWASQSPCEKWDARDVVRHVVIMHEAMLRPLGRQLSPAPSVDDNPLAAVRSARADIEAVFNDPDAAKAECGTPMGRITAEQHIDQALSDDIVLHGWDLARATGQDDTLDADDVERIWAAIMAYAPDLLDRLRTPEAFGPGIEVFGPEVEVSDDAPLQNRLLGMIGRDPR